MILDTVTIQAAKILEELQRRSEHKFTKYEPQSSEHNNQLSFHKSNAYIRLLFGGNQSGKSHSNSQEIAWWFTHSHPYLQTPKRPVVIWVISTEYATIMSGVYRHLRNLLPDWQIKNWGPKVQGHNMHSYVESIDGDLIQFMSAKGGDDSRTKFQAAAVDLIVIDEEIESYLWEEVQARQLCTAGKITISATLAESYDWIVDLERKAELGDPEIFLTRLWTIENKYADQNRIALLDNLWDSDTKEVRFFGKSRRQSGLIYKHFTKQHIIQPFKIPYDWPKWQILDPGFRVCAGLWGTVTPYGQIIIYRELYIEQAEVGDVADEIKSIEKINKETIDFRIIDDKEGSRLVTGQMGVMSQLSQYYDLFYAPAIKSVHVGIEEVRRKFKILPLDHDYEYELDDGSIIKLPASVQLFIFEICPHLRTELSEYKIRPTRIRRDKDEPVDKPIKKKDHLCDGLRYFLITYPSYEPRDMSQPEFDNPVRYSKDIIASFEEHQRRKMERKKVYEESLM